MAASRLVQPGRGDAIRAFLLAFVLAVLTVVPPDGRSTATPTGVVAAPAAAASATGHRLELHLQERSAPAWPGSQSAHWAVTGDHALAAPPEGIATAAAARPRATTAVELLANPGRAPPR